MDLKRKLVTVVLAVCLLASGMISCTNSKEKQQRIIDTFNSFTNAKEFVLITNDDIRLGDTVIDRDRVQYEGTHCLFIFSEADGTWAYANGGEGKVNIVFFEYETETATLVDSITVPGGAFAAEQYGGEFYFRADDPDTEEFKQIYYVYDPDTRETRTVGTDDLPIDIEKSGDHNRSSLYTIQSDMTSSMENKLIVTKKETGETKTVDSSILKTCDEGQTILSFTGHWNISNSTTAYEKDGDIYVAYFYITDGFLGAPCHIFIMKYDFDSHTAEYYTSVYYELFPESIIDLYIP